MPPISVLTVEASDGVNLDTAAITVDINNVNDNAPLINNATTNVNEDAINGTSVYNVDDVNTGNDTDQDGDALSYSITAGNTDGIFTINAATGEITLLDNTNLDFESTNQYVLTVEASDGTLNDTAAITIDINDVNETPTTTGIGDSNVNEDAATTPIDLFAAFDDQEDADNALTYSIVSNTNNALFDSTAIDGVTGILTLDYFHNANGSADITVRATDSGNQFADTAFTVNVNPINDAPETGVPGIQTTGEDTPLEFSAINGNLIAVSDVDISINPLEVTLNATDGTVSLAGTSGLSFITGTGAGDASMRFTGLVADVNTALDGLVFQPDAGFSGTGSLQMITDDLGNSGAGGALNDVDTIAINVTTTPPPPAPLDEVIVDDPPETGGPGPVIAPEEPTVEPVVDDPVVDSPDRVVLIDIDTPVTAGHVPDDNDVWYNTTRATAGPIDAYALDSATPHSPHPAPINLPGLFTELLDGLARESSRLVQVFSDGNDGADEELARTVARLAIVNPALPPLVISSALWDLLDTMNQDIDDNDGLLSNEGFTVATGLGLTLALSAGYVTWLIRFGYLAASLLSFAPMLAQFDPLPILAKRGRDKNSEQIKSAQTDDANVTHLFDLPRAAV